MYKRCICGDRLLLLDSTCYLSIDCNCMSEEHMDLEQSRNVYPQFRTCFSEWVVCYMQGIISTQCGTLRGMSSFEFSVLF